MDSRRRKGPGSGKEALEEIKLAIEKRLFLGRLTPETTEDELRRIFSEFGELTECRLVEGKSVGFVGFSTWAAAHRALKATDAHTTLEGHAHGQTMVANFAERTSKVGRGGGAYLAKGLDNARIFVGGLPEDAADTDMRALFESFGTIEGVSLLPAKTEKRCGFVNFSLWGEALDAIEKVDGTAFPGKGGSEDELMTVVFADPKPGQQQGWEMEAPGPKRRRVDEYAGASEFERLKASYIMALDGTSATEEACTAMHWELMRLRSAWSYPSASRSGGGGASSWAPAQAVIFGKTAASRSNERPLSGSEDPHVNQDAARLFIGGMPNEVTDGELRNLIEQLQTADGSRIELLECRVLPGRGCGYVRFTSWDAAQESMEALDERTVDGWQQPLRAKWAQPKDKGGGKGSWDSGKSGWGSDAGWRGGVHQASAALARSVPSWGQAQRSYQHGEIETQRLFVGQLQKGVGRDELYAIFEQFGPIDDFNLLQDKCVAYITYGNPDDAERGRAAMAGKDLPGISRGGGEGLNVQFSKKR